MRIGSSSWPRKLSAPGLFGATDGSSTLSTAALRTGHVAVAGEDAGVFDGCLGVALGGGGPQFGGNRGVRDEVAGTGVGFDRFVVTSGGVGFIAFSEELLRFVDRDAAAGKLAGGKAVAAAGITARQGKNQAGGS